MNVWIAAGDNDTKAVKKYIEHDGMSPNSKDASGYTPMHAAAAYGHIDLLNYLIEHGGDVHITDEDGDTPLHVVEDRKTAAWLIEKGADALRENEEGQTPLDKAAEDGDLQDLANFFRLVTGKQDEALPENMSMRVGYEPEEERAPDVSPEQRAELERIVESGTDADLEEFLKRVMNRTSASGNQRSDDTADESASGSKKARRD